MLNEDFETILDRAKNMFTEGLLQQRSPQGKQKVQDSLDLFTQCIDRDPDNPRLFLLRASACLTLKEIEKARHDLQKVKDMNLKDPRILDELGVAFLQAGDYDQAGDCFKNALLRIDPEIDHEQYFSIRFNHALMHVYQENHEKAVQEMEQVVREQPLNSRAYSLLGTLYESVKNYARAEQMYRQAITHATGVKDRAREYWLLGELYRRNKYYDQATHVYRLGMKTFPDELANLLGIWEAAIENGQPVQRIQDCITIVQRIAVHNLRHRFTLALLYMVSNQKEKAQEQFMLFLETTRTNPREWGLHLSPEIIRAQEYVEMLKRELS